MSKFSPRIVPDVPVDDSFKDYVDVVSKIIKNSEPRFTIGIFGGWGIGKTSFLKSLEKELKNNHNIVVVFFNAWRYERENHYATLPLLKSIYFALKNWESKNSSLKETTKEKLRKTLRVIEGIIKNTQLGFGMPGISVAISTGLGGSFDFEKENVEFLSEISPERNIYYDVLRYLEDAIRELRGENSEFRIVVLVDDLDRCAPDKAVEILNSIKIFLDIEGIVYVIALNPNVTEALLQRYYEKVGYSKEYSSEDYLSKFFQVWINLPEWDKEEIAKNVIEGIFEETMLRSEISDPKELEKLKVKIVNALEESLTPRQIKRFLNAFILRYALAKSINEREKFRVGTNKLLELVLDISIVDYLWPDLIRGIEKEGESGFRLLSRILEGDEDSIGVSNNKNAIEKLRKLLRDSPLFECQYELIRKILKIRSVLGEGYSEYRMVFPEMPFFDTRSKAVFIRSLFITRVSEVLSEYHYFVQIGPVTIDTQNKRVTVDIIVIMDRGYIPIVVIPPIYPPYHPVLWDGNLVELLKTAPEYLGKPLEKIIIVKLIDNTVFVAGVGYVFPQLAKNDMIKTIHDFISIITDEKTKGQIVTVYYPIENIGWKFKIVR